MKIHVKISLENPTYKDKFIEVIGKETKVLHICTDKCSIDGRIHVVEVATIEKGARFSDYSFVRTIDFV